MTHARVFADGRLTIAGSTYRVALGRAGIVQHKQEGDGATPAGLLPLRKILYRADRIPRPQAAVPVEPLAPTDGWCDDPSHADYNRMVRLPHDGRHEELWRRDPLYDLVGVLGWNDSPVQRGRGSAIFLHVAQPDYAPTEGCVALAYRDLAEVITSLTSLETG
jgi:L,D-peptidoglycan transpeptidase YkuD (ErfK/YbiS/YcfS/YnhG family)